MNVSEIFGILQIPETKEEGEIRAAYYRLLTGVNPEDDPEGFKRLRRAYEEGIAYVRGLDKEETASGVEWLQNQEAGRLLQQLADIYEDISRRQDLDQWKNLLSDEFFQSLEDGETAKWILFSYLAEHFYLPWHIWKFLDQEFSIERDQEELKEHLPKEFVDYMVTKLQTNTRKGSFPFEKLKGQPKGDYDGFIREYGKFVQEKFEPTKEGLKEKGRWLEKISLYAIDHPWFDLELAKYQADQEAYEKAAEMARKLIKENPEDEHIWILGANLLSICGQEEDARRVLDDYLTWEEQTLWGKFHAFSGLAEMEAEQGRWERAKALSDNARVIHDTEELKKLQDQIHKKLIENYRKREESLADEEAYLLCRCFVESGQYEQGLAFFISHPEYCQNTAQWHRQLSALKLKAGRVEEAFKETEAWRQCMLVELKGRLNETKPDESLTKELAMNAYMEGEIYNKCYMQEMEKETSNPETLKELADKALVWYDRALELQPNQVEFLTHKMLLLREQKEHQKVIDLCEKILEIAPSFFPPYSYLQEAYENLKMPQEVVNTFYRAKNIYDGNSEIYLRAVRVFLAYQQYQDALEILHQAKKAGAMNFELQAKKIIAMCRLVHRKDKRAWKEADNAADLAIEQMTQEGADPGLLAELYLERAYLNENNSNLHNKEKARILQYAKKALELNDNIHIRYFLGRFYLEYNRDYKQAYEHLKSCEDRGMTFSGMYLFLGNCQEYFKNYDLALSYYSKAIENDPYCQNAFWRTGRIWRNKCKNTLQVEYAHKALYYFDQVEERFGASLDVFRLRSYLYLILRDYDQALFQAEKGLEQGTDSGLLLLKGRALRMLGHYEEAVKYFESSISCQDTYGGSETFCYGQIFQCFLVGKRFQEGMKYFEKVLESTEKEEIREACLDHIADYASMTGDFQLALSWVKRRYKTVDLSDRGQDTWERAGQRVRSVMYLWLIFQPELDELFFEKCREGAELAEKVLKDDNALQADQAKICQDVGEAYFCAGDYKTARTFLERAYRVVKNREDYDESKDLAGLLMKCCYWMGDLEKAKEYGVVYRKLLEKDYKECEDLGLSMEELLSRSGPDSKQRLYHLFCYAYYTGQYEKARDYAEKMFPEKMCWWCQEEGCAEEWEIRGLLAFLDKKYEESQKAFEQENRVHWLNGSSQAHQMLRMIKNYERKRRH